ncbi:NADPH-dependent FMN reductase [Hansschlegelia quercus]|uniref:FMN reductase (NADPH) n=1 Tax=Hansschlegelia quercus TaxID=2528245 RepID=A0A4Q9GPQ6_9HYPH|nr:NADPH-dependent FMN reductase [Hansschlegelia quercus]TBN53597.1 FMN reductase (NADPH) [Hansschlegelia quercus]
MPFILVVSGSPSENSKTAKLAQYVSERLAERGMRTKHLRVRDLPAGPLLSAQASDPAIGEAIELVELADGVVFVTPTYKASFSGLLKTFIDLLPQFALTGKAILPLATGGTMAHVLMLDYALRPILHALGARHSVQGHFMIESALDPAGPEFITDIKHREMLHQAISHFDQAVSRTLEAA